MKRKKVLSLFCPVFLLFLTACKSTNEPLVSSNADLLLEHSWKLVEIQDMNGQTVFTLDTVWSYSISFLKDGKIQAQNACNSCGGTYRIEPYNHLAINISCTEMVCTPPPSFAEYEDALNLAVEFKIVNNRLWIKYDDGTGALFYLIHRSM